MELIEPFLYDSWVKKTRLNDVRILIQLLYWTGIRINEVLQLSPLDFVEVSDGYLRINAPLSKNRFIKRRPLEIPLSNKDIKDMYDSILKLNPYALIFIHTARYYHTKLKELDPDLSAHRFRHNRLTQLAREGFREFELRDWAGHSDTRTASRYIQISGALANQAIRRVKIE